MNSKASVGGFGGLQEGTQYKVNITDLTLF